MARGEHTVTAMQYAGPATLLAVAARTVLVDQAAAEAYLTRLRRSGAWLDQMGERLRAGARKGRLPVAPLAEQAITWAEAVLAGPGPRTGPGPPAAGRDGRGTAAWEDERRRVAAEVVKPALARWVATVSELLPRARPSEQAGLVHLPGGEEDYARAVRSYTTLPLHRGRAAPDRPGPHRRAGGPGRGAGRRAGALRAGRGVRRAAGLGREDTAGRGHPRGGGGGASGPRPGRRSSSRSRCRRRAR